MRYAPRALVAGGLGFAVSCLVACGSGGAGLLSGDQSSSLNSQLDSISAAVNSGNCGGATQAVAAFARTVTNLPVTVSLTLRRNLLQGANTVGVLAQRDCSTSSTSPRTSTTPPKTTTTTDDDAIDQHPHLDVDLDLDHHHHDHDAAQHYPAACNQHHRSGYYYYRRHGRRWNWRGRRGR